MNNFPPKGIMMEFKLNLSQIIGAIVQALAYFGLILALAWRVSRQVAQIENKVENAVSKIEETNTRMEKTFDKIDRTFEKVNDKLDQRSRGRQ